MPLFLLIIGRWLASKAFLYGAVAVLAVGLFAFFMFAKNSMESDRERVAELLKLEERAGDIYGELTEAHGRLVELGSEIEQSRQRLDSARRVVDLLDGLLKRIERLVAMTPSERAKNESDLAAAQIEASEQGELLNRFVGEQSRLRINRTSLTIEATDLESRISALEGDSSQFVEYIETSWLKLKPYLIVTIVSVITIPIAVKLFAFYVWAPLLTLAGPMQFSKESLPGATLLKSGVSAQVEMKIGQRLWVREAFLQASDEVLKRKTRFVLNWSIPCACLAGGLVEMVELTCEDGSGKVTISPQKKAELELSLVEIPVGGEIVLRPSALAGVLSQSGDPVAIKRRWRLFHPQAWLTFQFRYFVFQGPCTLAVAGTRGVRFESLDGDDKKGRRTNQIATIGFTPDLTYGVVRAETFWSYFRGYNPLFDDVFRGKGVFLCEEITDKNATSAATFWKNLWSGALKVLGV